MLVIMLCIGHFFSWIGTADQPQIPISPGDLYNMAAPSVVLIETYGEDGKVSGNGSGFIVSSDGMILTNYHVVAHTKRATVRLANNDAYDYVGVLDTDKRKDIALIKIKAVNLPYLKLGHSSSAKIGDTLYALGNPLGILQNTLSEGILSSVRQADGYRLFQLSTPISHGSSGSPVFDAKGEVVGLIESTIEEGQNLNFAIPIDYAVGMLSSKEIRPLVSIYEPEPPSEPESRLASKVEPTIVPTAPESLKRDAIVYLGDKVGKWTKEDAEKELGEPIDRRDALSGATIIGDVYKYKSPAPGFAAIELNFDRTRKSLTAAYFYYDHLVAWTTIRNQLGRSYKKAKLANGQPAYTYQFQSRQLCVILDSANNVYDLGIW
jgi:trypsin-like peptidase